MSGNNIEIIENTCDFEMLDYDFENGEPIDRPAAVVLNISKKALLTTSGHTPGRYSWAIAPLTAEGANGALREILPLAERLAAADADDDDAAIDALSREIESICAYYYTESSSRYRVSTAALEVLVVSPGDADEYGITADTTNAEIDDIADHGEADIAKSAGLGGAFCPELRGYLQGLRDELLKERED